MSVPQKEVQEGGLHVVAPLKRCVPRLFITTSAEPNAVRGGPIDDQVLVVCILQVDLVVPSVFNNPLRSRSQA